MSASRPAPTCRRLRPTLAAVALLGSLRLPAAHAQVAGSWQPLGPPGGDVSILLATEPATLLAGSLTGSYFRSTDAAAHWSPIGLYAPSPEGTVNTLAADPTTPTTVYAATGAVWKSVDAGVTWSLLFSPPPPTAVF